MDEFTRKIAKDIAREAGKALTEKINDKTSKSIAKRLSLPINAGFIGSVAVSTFLARSAYERESLEYARYDIDGAGKAADNVRLLYLTDLHEKEFGKGNCRLLEMIDKADPDAVLIGGDMVIADKHDSEHVRTKVTFSLCKELVGKYPVFYGEGNHEMRLVERFREALENIGVRYLKDETVNWKYNLAFTGVNLGKEQYKAVSPQKPKVADLIARTGPMDPDRFNVLLAHSPLFIEEYAGMGADLVLSGHFHGGTIRLPGEVGLMTPQYQLFNTNVVGMKQFDRTFMVISSGLGTHSINIRINNKPQVVVVDIKK